MHSIDTCDNQKYAKYLNYLPIFASKDATYSSYGTRKYLKPKKCQDPK